MTEEIRSCRHHWLLNEPKDEVIVGVCKLCGDRREFMAYPEGGDHDERGQGTAFTLAAPRPVEVSVLGDRRSR